LIIYINVTAKQRQERIPHCLLLHWVRSEQIGEKLQKLGYKMSIICMEAYLNIRIMAESGEQSK
jgi:hypothetical protein